MILPVVAQFVVSRSGWREAYVSLGVLALLLGLPLSWRYIVERGPAQKESAPVAHPGLTWQRGMRTFASWIIVAVLFVSSISMAFYAAAGATGPVILARAFDSTGSYASLLVILAVALSGAAATNLLLPNYPAASR